MSISNSDIKKIVQHISLASFFVFAAKLITFIKEIILAKNYGTNTFLESYLFLFNFFNLIGGIFLFTIIFSVVPALSNCPKNQKKQFKIQIVNFFSKVSFFIVLICAIILALGIKSDLFSLNIQVKEITSRYYFYFLIIFPLWVLTFILTAFLIEKKTQIGSFYESLPSIITIILLFIIPNDFLPLILGFSLGIVLQLFFLFFHQINDYKLQGLEFKNTAFSGFIQNVKIVFFIQILLSSQHFIDHFILARMAEKTLVQFSYSYKAFTFFQTFGLLILSRTILPFFSEPNLSKKINEKTIIKQLNYCFIIFTILAFILYFFANEIITIIFQRGEFSDNDSLVVANLFKIFTLMLPFYMCYIFVITFLYSRNDYGKILKFCYFFIFLKVFYLILTKEIFAETLIYSTLIASIFGFIYLYREILFKKSNRVT